jgi:hypothetical protein
VEIRFATVSLLGLNLSCGKVSHAGNSRVSVWHSRISFAKSSAALEEAVITKIGFLIARSAIKYAYDAGGAIRSRFEFKASSIA